jgi:hypothetical protein
MSSNRLDIPSRAWLLPSAALLLGALVRASTATGAVGALALLKMLVTPAAVAMLFIFVQLTNGFSQESVAPVAVAMSRRGMYFLIVVTDLLLLAVIVLGTPFLTAMNSAR